MSSNRNLEARTVILTHDARQIPQSVLVSGALIIEDSETFLELVSDSAIRGYVNLAGVHTLSEFSQFENLLFYVPIEAMGEIKQRNLDEFARYSLQIEDTYLWLRRGEELKWAIEMAVMLQIYQERCSQLEAKQRVRNRSEQPENQTRTVPKRIFQDLETLGRRIYPKLPKRMQSLGLTIWSRLGQGRMK